MSSISPGARLRQLVRESAPVQVVGTINAYTAIQAEQAGHQAIYLSGAGVANASYGLPDLGITQLADVVEDARRITGRCDLPLLVDIDTGWGSAFNIARSIREMERAGVAAVHLEDQVQAKRCGHRPNKALVSTEEMVDRVRAAVDARHDESFVFMARTDAHASEGMNAAVDRANRYVEAGADMIFAEALHTIEEFRTFARAVPVPVLANITEFGKTPLFSVEELAEAGIGLVLYPLSAFRAMSQAALDVYQAIAGDGHQKNVVDRMQTRADLYETLGYHEFESKLDQLFTKESS
ncbi:methylisocitrate lyase [Wenzhouxiangella marina]|uniref:2-methylisocitrate lyase n=1 Tax=Wenzhouxiangella marina TaxID=1579979 RepID=A0A0K0XWS6_9GAMM|nr:methylisocitrate lyase [Wenzhouxiangella marina]AKS42133.1 Methylisocitrate lyase [Wenzhouxiangella marina]MBB6086095.1 methylisocitrate lyase [Wenzhouxiangella marina]